MVCVEALGADCGLSQRQFLRRFVKQVGVRPGAYRRLCRLSAAIDMGETHRDLSWTEIACACDYADQAHLTREFRALALEAPRRFRRYRFAPPVAG